ncbi:MAG: hypothetical protein ACTHMM_19030 [Agriterribacter sp.]
MENRGAVSGQPSAISFQQSAEETKKTRTKKPRTKNQETKNKDAGNQIQPTFNPELQTLNPKLNALSCPEIGGQNNSPKISKT